MRPLDSLEYSCILDDLECIQEMDASSFVAIAKSNMTKASVSIDTTKLVHKLNHYVDSLNKAKGSIEYCIVDTSLLPLLNKDITGLDAKIPAIQNSNISVIKPQYLSQYVTIIGELIDKSLNNTASQAEIDRLLSNDMETKVKKQICKADEFPVTFTVKSFIKSSSPAELVPLNKDYIDNQLKPFLQSFDNEKKLLVKETNMVIEVINETITIVNGMNDIVNEKLKDKDIDTINRVRKVSYNGLRSILNVVSRVTLLMIHKINIFMDNICTATRVPFIIENYYSPTFEGMDNFIIGDSTNLAEAMLRGDGNVYEPLANNIYEFYQGSLINKLGISNTEFNMLVDNVDYDKDVYDDITKVFIEISNGLDIIGKMTDEYLVVFDDVVEKSGFVLRLEDRFKNDIDSIVNISLTNNNLPIKDKLVEFSLLRQVKDYPALMDTLANTILDVNTKLEGLDKRINDNVNNEFKDLEAIHEISLFLVRLKEEFDQLVEDVSDQFMIRLRKLGEALANSCLDTTNDKMEDPTKEYPVEDSIDYLKEAFLIEYDLMEESIKSELKALQDDFYKEKLRVFECADVILEAEDASASTPSPNSIKPTVVDNSSQNTTNNNDNTNTNPVSKLSEIIQKLLSKLQDFINQHSAKNKKWLSENKEEWLNRSYSNVNASILPYDSIAVNTIATQISNLTHIVQALSPQDMQGMNDEDALYNKLFTFVNGGVKKANGSVTDQIRNFYRGGTTSEPTMKTYANNELKTFVTNEMIPFCEGYYDTFFNNIQSALTALGKACDDTCNKLHADANPNKDTAKNTESSLAMKKKWLQVAIKDYTTALLNAIRDRNNDYIKLLSNLIPKNPSNTNNVEPNPNNENNQNA